MQFKHFKNRFLDITISLYTKLKITNSPFRFKCQFICDLVYDNQIVRRPTHLELSGIYSTVIWKN